MEDDVLHKKMKNLTCKMKLLDFPDSVLLHVAKCLDRVSLLAFSMTCKALKEVEKEVEAEWGAVLRDGEIIEVKYIFLGKDSKPFNLQYCLSSDWFKWAYRMTEGMCLQFVRSGLVLLASEQGSLRDLIWLHKEGCMLERLYVWDHAAYGGHLHLFEYLKEQKIPFPYGSSICDWAARNGQLEAIKWLRKEGCPTHEYHTCMEAAAEGGQWEVLKWLNSDEGYDYEEWNQNTMKAAAGGGHLEIVKLLRCEGCPWDIKSCWSAVYYGHLEVLKYLYSEGCPWDLDYLCNYADQHSHIKEWLSTLPGYKKTSDPDPKPDPDPDSDPDSDSDSDSDFELDFNSIRF